MQYWGYLMPLIIFPARALGPISHQLSLSLTRQQMGCLKKKQEADGHNYAPEGSTLHKQEKGNVKETGQRRPALLWAQASSASHLLFLARELDRQEEQPARSGLLSRSPATRAPHGYFWLTLLHHCNLKPATLQAATAG